MIYLYNLIFCVYYYHILYYYLLLSYIIIYYFSLFWLTSNDWWFQVHQDYAATRLCRLQVLRKPLELSVCMIPLHQVPWATNWLLHAANGFVSRRNWKTTLHSIELWSRTTRISIWQLHVFLPQCCPSIFDFIMVSLCVNPTQALYRVMKEWFMKLTKVFGSFMASASPLFHTVTWQKYAKILS